ncbi:MAG: AmmeMemoRadiSam system protein A, partial [Sulfurimonas sp. RIFCSPLOWO2_12_FULL_34_6]
MIGLTEIARRTIEEHFKGKEFIPDDKTKEYYKEKQACFVTLTFGGKLRGCIGSLEARQELWKNVAENAVSAAFYDTRFIPLKKEELKKIKIEVSVLSPP